MTFYFKENLASSLPVFVMMEIAGTYSLLLTSCGVLVEATIDD